MEDLLRGGFKTLHAQLWRYALVLSRANDAADDLVQATCVRAIERADQFVPGTRLDRWLFTILRSIWQVKFVHAGFANAADSSTPRDTLSIDGAREIETNIFAAEVLKAVGRLSWLDMAALGVCTWSRPKAAINRGPIKGDSHDEDDVCGARDCGSAGIALAATGADAIKERRALMKADGAVTRPVFQMLQGRASFDLAIVQKALKTYENAASKEPALFPPDSKTGDTNALPVIWDDDNMADLDARFKKLGADAAAALATIKDEASFKTTMPGVLNNCDGCHEKYHAKQQ